MNTWDLYLADAAGLRDTPLPGVLELTWSDDDDEPGGGTFTYSLLDPDGSESTTSDLLIGTAEVCLILDGDIQPSSANWELSQSSKTILDAETGKAIAIQYAFTSLLARFDDFPLVWPAEGELVEAREFEGTAIAIFKEAIDSIQARGGLAGFTYDFTALLDTHGEPHDPDTGMKITAESTWTLLDLWRVLRDRRGFDLLIRKHVIRAFNYGTKGTDYEPAVPGDPPAFILEAGRDLLNGQRKADLSNIRNVARVEGSDGRWALAADNDSITQYGRREWVLPATDVTDQDVLQQIADLAASQYAHPIVYKAYTIRLQAANADAAPHPYDPDWSPVCGSRVAIRDDDSAIGIQYGRVKNVRTSIDRNGQIECELAIETRRASAEARRDWAIQELLRGLPGSPVKRNKMPPAAPTSLGFSTGTEIPDKGPETAWLQPAWTLPTTDADGEPLRDLGRIEVRWRIGTARWRRVDADAADTNARITGLPLGTSVDVQVYAVDTSGNYSAALVDSETTAVGTGEYRATDTTGAPIFTVAGDDWNASKVAGGVLAATGPGVDLDSIEGVRLYGASGALTIHLNAADGSAMFAGDVEIGGDTTISGTTTIDGTLTVDADTIVNGTFTVNSSGSPVLTVDAGGMELIGRLETGTGNIVIDGDVISLGTADITFSGDQIQLTGTTSLSVAGSISGSSTLTITGTATLGGALDHNGSTAGILGASPVGTQPVGAAAIDALTTRVLANNLRTALINFGLCVT